MPYLISIERLRMPQPDKSAVVMLGIVRSCSDRLENGPSSGRGYALGSNIKKEALCLLVTGAVHMIQ